MERTTFRDTRLAETLNRDCVPLSVDGDAEKKLIAQWGVKLFPTHMIVGATPGLRGKVLERMEGRQGVAELLEAVQRAARQTAMSKPKAVGGRDSAVKPASATMPAKSAVTPPSPTEADLLGKAPRKSPSFGESAQPLEKAPVALDGFCPVCMIERTEMIAGKSTETGVYGGKTYRFASAEHRKTFLATPSKYLPGANGDCPVTLVEDGKRTSGSTKYPALFADRVFFLSSEAAQKRFLKEPQKYVSDKGEPRAAK
jgi:YHS domain-containing protein